MTDFALARRNMVEGQLRPNRVNDAGLLAALGELPRERFLGEPSFDAFRRNQAAFGYELEHRLNARWSLRQVFWWG